jgi:NDP-sugar pyrophosphorylase family protein
MPRAPDVILLCGGAGLRLRSVIANAPKAMAQISGRPFLELLLRQLRRYRFERAILAVGYGQDMIRSQFGERAFGLELKYSVEPSPLGTGGAVRNAAQMVASEAVLVMNGDSYTDVDLGGVALRHHETTTDVSMVVVPAAGRSDYGSVFVDGNGVVIRFAEKPKDCNAPYINAGIYVLSRPILRSIQPNIQLSLEKDLIPRWIQDGVLIKALIHPGACVDIGTPDRYKLAQQLLASAESEAPVSAAGE